MAFFIKLPKNSVESADHIPPPKPAIAAVQLPLNAASSEGHMLEVNSRNAPPGILLTRHSFSGGGRNDDGQMQNIPAEKAAAIDASRKLLGLAQAHLNNGTKEDADGSPTQLRRLSAL